MDGQSSGTEVIPYRAWWGLLGCAAIVAVVMLLAPFNEGIDFAPDKGAFDYYWKLPDPTAITRATAWISYALHQIAIWYLIAQARAERPKYINGLHPINVKAISVNLFFIVWHIVQTRVWYDGLAQDVHEGTALASVAIMLFVVIIMENERRGMFFGAKVPFLKRIGEAARRYHGYYFAWAFIYTFWYHPIETTAGHLVGFFYMFMLLLQGSLFFTRYHTNRVWTAFLEVFAMIHGSIVAYFAVSVEGVQWTNFFFGGLLVFVVTQMHGIGLKVRTRWIIGFVAGLATGLFYVFYPEMMERLPRIFLTRYGAVAITALLIWLILLVCLRGKPLPART